MRFRPSFLVAPFVVVAASLVALGACSNQGEGEVCDILNGSADCQDDLVCGPSPNADIKTSDHPDRCCPPQGTPSTVPGCVQIITPVTDFDGSFVDAPVTPGTDASDAGTPGTSDASDAGPAAPVDASGTDAAASDAAGDAGSALDAADASG